MHVHDRLVKIECLVCREEFLVSEYVLKQKTDEEYPGNGCYCPYCGNIETQAITWTGDNTDFADEMGCLAISHFEIGEGEVLNPWRITNEDTGESEVIEALDFGHAIDIYRRKGLMKPGRYSGDLLD
ncbi:MAG: hypothetical protein GXY34_05190 [Syntrophomonadaceae bacterium]|nr:hypothetical protein [Syntrophomonadaceae bacterium]